MIITVAPAIVTSAELCREAGPVALIDVWPIEVTETWDAVIVTPLVSMVMLFAPTVSLIDCAAVIELDPALTVIE